MVGIYKISCGLRLVAVSKDEASAKRALFNKFEKHPAWFASIEEWWEHGKRNYAGAPHSFVIKEIELWES